jgi:NAD(P)-dependent dehydrogenase (short-subunit alcohol dehydrogenase family)
MQHFTDQVIVVTGGTSGIGQDVVNLLTAQGARVALIARNPKKGQAVTDATGAHLYIADMQDEAAITKAFQAIEHDFKHIDGLVANAGVGVAEGMVHLLPSGTWDHVENTDLRGTFLTVKEALIRMVKQQSGSIVCVSSVVAHSSILGVGSAYAAAKGAIESFSRSVAVDYGRFGIRCNTVAPGATDTPMMWVNVPAEQIQDVEASLNAAVPLGRLAKPAEIARGIIWLLSDEADYVTGATLIIDGGVTAKSVLPA